MGNMPLMCSHRPISAAAGVRLVVSDKGDILSPKKAPDTIAPAVMAGGMPSPSPMPIIASPTVPAVPQEVPVAKEITAQIRHRKNRKLDGVKKLKP